MPLRLVLVSFLAAGLIPLSAGAAQSVGLTLPPKLKPGWYVRSQYFPDLSAAERPTVERILTAAEGLITSTTGYARPGGFEAQAHWVSQPQATGRLRTYWVEIKGFLPTWDAGNGGYTSYVQILFNPEVGHVSDGTVKSETGEFYYHERSRSPAAYGTTFVYGTYGVSNSTLRVLFTAHNQDPMLPVSREEYLRARIHEFDGDGTLKEAQASVTKTPYQEWTDGAAQRKKEREELLAAMSDRAAAEKMRASLEQTERDVTEGLKKSEKVDVENMRTFKGLDPSKPLRDELAAMSPQGRASQAWAGGTALMPAGAPNALRVVRANPAFFRPRASPVEPRAILVILHEPWQGITSAQNQLHAEFDWAAIRKLLDSRP